MAQPGKAFYTGLFRHTLDDKARLTIPSAWRAAHAAEDTFLLHPALLDLVTGVEARNGLLSLVVRANDDGALMAHAEGLEITLDASDTMHAVAAVHELLRSAGIFISPEMADL